MKDFNCKTCIHKDVCSGYEVTMPDCDHYQGWINVKDKLPEYNPDEGAQAYWVAFDAWGGKQMRVALYSDYMYASLTDMPPCVTWRDYESHKIAKVTHWQPLPEPPKGE